MKSPISSVLIRFTRLSWIFCSCPDRTCTTYHCFRFCSSVIGLGLEKETADSHHRKVEDRNKRGEQQHRDDDDDGRVDEFLVLRSERLFLRVPRPGRFEKLGLDLAEEVGGFGEHGL